MLAVAAAIPLLLGLAPRVPVPSELAEIVAGVVIGPSVLGWVHPDEVIRALALFGLSFLLFLGGFEVDVRRFRGRTGHHVLLAVTGSAALAAGVGVVCGVIGVRGGSLVAISLLATWTGPVVRTLTDTGALHRRVGVLTVACASAGAMAGWSPCRSAWPNRTRRWQADCFCWVCWSCCWQSSAASSCGAEHVGRVDVLVKRLADTSAQIRIRLTVLLVAGVALAAFGLGFEAVLGAFLAGVLVRTLDPEPEVSHPYYPIKLEAVGFGLLIPVFFISSGMTLDVRGLAQDPRALAGVPAADHRPAAGSRSASPFATA